MADFVDYEIWLGSFEGETWKWKTIKKFNSFEKASAFFEEYKKKQSSYNAEELSKIWGSGRIDIELRQGKKLINWVGMYYRKAANPDWEPDEPSDDDEVEDSHPERMI